MSDCKITCLPEEMITHILNDNVITIEDIINFRCVCKQFRYAAKYDKFWEKKLSQRWPDVKRQYKIFKETKDGENMNFLTRGLTCATQVRNYLSHILFYDYYYNNRSNQNYCNRPIDDVIGFIDNLDEFLNCLFENKPFLQVLTFVDEMKYMFYIDEIKYFLSQSPREIDRNLIERYCEIKSSHYLKLSSIRNELGRYRKKPEREQLLEETCTFVAKYIQVRKDVCYTNVSASLDTIAQEVLNRLRKKHPNHSIFFTCDEAFSYWKTNNIKENHWDETESTQIMDTLQEYIFGTLNFRACSSFRIHVNCLCIDYVLQSKYGQDIIVLTIYHSVARRLGLRCDVIFARTKICIFWKPKYLTNNLGNARCFCIKDENFPNFFSNYLGHYTGFKSLMSLDLSTAIRTKEILLLLKDFYGMFIARHELTTMKLVKVHSNVLLKYLR